MKRAFLVLTGCTLLACSEPAAPAPAASSVANAPSSANAAARPEAAPTTVDEKAVRALIDGWLAAQNKGDFAAYEKLYADKLEGIKRSGPRVWRYDRKGFLGDRERMFKKPMTVEATNIVVTAGAASALVELEQRFKQGSFEDKGPKRLVVVEEKGALKIAREEMVQSVVAGASPTNAAGFRHVVEVGGKPYVVLGPRGDVSWASGPAAWAPRREAHPDFLVVRPAAKAPAEHLAWRGRVLKVYDEDGNSCDATVGEIALLSGGTPHFGEVQRWDGDPGPDGAPTAPKLSLEQRAANVFGMTTPHLVGALELPKGCAAAFALEAAKPTFFEAKGAPASDDPALRAAIAAFKGLPSYQASQKSFVEDFQQKGDWAPKIEVAAFEGNGRRFLAVEASVVAGCADFNGEATALFEITSGNRAVLVAEGVGRPTSVFDSDGNGAIELFAERLYDGGLGRYLVAGPNGIASETALDFPNNDCGC